MTTDFHTPIATGAAANAAIFNSPLSSLDTAVSDNRVYVLAHQAELAGSRGGYGSLGARLDALVLAGGNVATLTNGAASAGQKVVDVDSTTGFIAGAYVAYMLAGGSIEYNVIDAVTSPTRLTMDNNVGSGGIADDTYVAMISPSEYQAANAINHGDDPLTLPTAMAYAAADAFNVMAYGATGDGSTDDTDAIQAAIDAAKSNGGGIVYLPKGTYKLTAAIDLCETANIALVGMAGHFGTEIQSHNSDGAIIEIIGSKQIRLQDLKIVGHGTNTPAVGIWTGRTEPGVYGAGEDTSQIVGDRLYIYGAFTGALIYNTGCESNWWNNCYLYATNAACLAGVMTDYHNGLGLTPEHTTLTDPPIPQVMSVINRCLITCDSGATAYSPIYTVYDYSPEIYNSYLCCWGAPAVYLKGGMPGNGLIIRDTGVEGTPTYLIYGDYMTPSGGVYGPTFRLDLYRFGGSAGSSGYSIFLEDNSVLVDSEISQCSFSGNVRFYTIQNSRIGGLSWYGVSNPALTIAGDVVDSYIRVCIDDVLTIAGAMLNVVIDYDKDYGTGYLLLAGNKGLAIGGAPGAAQQAVTRIIRTASATWNPGAIADGAAATTYVSVTDVVNDGTWFCKASYTGLAAYGWTISAYGYNGAVLVTIENRSGGPITPTGTLYVVAEKITET